MSPPRFRLGRGLFGADALTGLGIAVAACFGLLTAYGVLALRSDAWDHAREAGHNLVSALNEDISRTVETLDLSLLGALAALDRPGLHEMDPAIRHSIMFDRAVAARHIYSILVLDERGDVVADSLALTPRLGNLADREFFGIHQRSASTALHVSHPFALRFTPELAIGFSRRRFHPDGSFAGVVVGVMRLTSLRDLFGSMTIGPESSISLHHLDGTTLMRAPYRDDVIGANVLHGTAFQRMLRLSDGQFTDVARLDGVERLYSFARISGAPLSVNVAQARTDIEAGWRRRAVIFGSAATVLIAVLLFSTLRLRREVGLRRLAERESAAAHDAAVTAGRARSQFLAVMSHEIRTPANGVIGMSELLLGTGLDAEQVRFATTLRRSADHLVRLLNDILDFSRLDAGRIVFETLPFSVAEVAQDAFGLLEGQAREKRLAYELTMPEPMPWVMGDPARLRQVLLNLLSNAVKFTEAGGVALVVHPPVVEDGALRLCFEVLDTGPGIAAEVLPRLFQEFTQADDTIARRYGGSGLGLSICRRLLQGMRGEITARSTPGEGSCFRCTLLLPEAAEPAPVRLSAPDDPAHPPRCLRILVAEDDPTNQLVAAGLLGRMGHEVVVVDTGQAAIAALSERGFDLVLMDVMMPGMDGLEATRRVRAGGAPGCDIPIIAATANASGEDAVACRAAGMTDVLVKPLTISRLAAMLQTHAGPGAGRMPAPPPASKAKAPAIRQDVLVGYAVQLGRDAAEEIRDGFLAELEERLARTLAAARQEQRDLLRREAHALKGSAEAVGLLAMSAAAASLEHAAPKAEAAALVPMAERLETTAREGATLLSAVALPLAA